MYECNLKYTNFRNSTLHLIIHIQLEMEVTLTHELSK